MPEISSLHSTPRRFTDSAVRYSNNEERMFENRKRSSSFKEKLTTTVHKYKSNLERSRKAISLSKNFKNSTTIVKSLYNYNATESSKSLHAKLERYIHENHKQPYQLFFYNMMHEFRELKYQISDDRYENKNDTYILKKVKEKSELKCLLDELESISDESYITIKYVGNAGVDAGGLLKQFFLKLNNQLVIEEKSYNFGTFIKILHISSKNGVPIKINNILLQVLLKKYSGLGKKSFESVNDMAFYLLFMCFPTSENTTFNKNHPLIQLFRMKMSEANSIKNDLYMQDETKEYIKDYQIEAKNRFMLRLIAEEKRQLRFLENYLKMMSAKHSNANYNDKYIYNERALKFIVNHLEIYNIYSDEKVQEKVKNILKRNIDMFNIKNDINSFKNIKGVLKKVVDILDSIFSENKNNIFTFLYLMTGAVELSEDLQIKFELLPSSHSHTYHTCFNKLDLNPSMIFESKREYNPHETIELINYLKDAKLKKKAKMKEDLKSELIDNYLNAKGEIKNAFTVA